MSYGYSNLDRSNLKWFENEFNHSTLKSIKLVEGQFRSLKPFDLEFKYPITAISGVNGSGKTTILALSALAFQNDIYGYIPDGRNQSSYKFNDFFVRSRGELPPHGTLKFGFLYDKWKDGAGLWIQERKRPPQSRWSIPKSVPCRNVVYVGLNRAVPYNERTTYKNYRYKFKKSNTHNKNAQKICELAYKILQIDYTSYNSLQIGNLTLKNVSVNDTEGNSYEYTGFNMGVGENVVFDILHPLFASGKNTLLLIDEIEFGLHESAQIKIIEELKEICKKMRCQIITTTHSSAIINSLPPEGRIFIEPRPKKTKILPEISVNYAARLMGNFGASDLNVFVEDEVSKAIIHSWLPNKIKRRMNIVDIGSAETLLRQLSSYFNEGNEHCLCILDGEQRNFQGSLPGKLIKYTEANDEEKESKIKEWSKLRIQYLPSKFNPETWLLNCALKFTKSKNKKKVKDYLKKLGTTPSEFQKHIKSAIKEEKSQKIYELSRLENMAMYAILIYLIEIAKEVEPKAMDDTINEIKLLLNQLK